MARHGGGDFGEYEGIPLTGPYGDISAEKLFDEFILENYYDIGQEVEYIHVIEKLAKKFNAGEWDEKEQSALEACRQLAAGDHERLKADFIMTIFVVLGREQRHKVKGEGRRLGLNDAQIKSVLRHYDDESRERITQKAFCELTGITKTAYNRVINRDYIHGDDVCRVDKLAYLLYMDENPGYFIV
jgi:hypothetical protein